MFKHHGNRSTVVPIGAAAQTSWETLVIRGSDDDDAHALAQLADLDSRTLPEGRFLLAELNGEIVAAAPLDVAEPTLADPFRPTARIRTLLEQQVHDLWNSTPSFGIRTSIELQRAA